MILTTVGVAIVAFLIGAFVMPDQEPFDGSRRGGDPSFREIPADADPSLLVDSHRSQTFDHGGLQRDANLAFPLERAREQIRAAR